MKRCPKCGGEEFCATAHVTQDWLLNKTGTFVKSLNDCVETTHYPDDNDIWDCHKCGFSAAGSVFNVEEETAPPETLDLRDLVADEVEYHGHDVSVIDRALHYIKNSNQLMEMLDNVVAKAISAVNTEEG